MKPSATVIFSVLFALVVAEVALRFLPSPVNESPLLPDDELMYRLSPGGEIDQHGYRNKDGTPKDAIAIGDSQTYGVNARSEGSWPAQAGMYNMGVPGYGPYQYHELSKRVRASDGGAEKKIIWGLYLGNDIFDAYNYVHRADELDETALAPSSRDWLINLRLWIRGNSRLYALLGDATYGLRHRFGLAESLAEKRKRDQGEFFLINPGLGEQYKDTILTIAYRRQAVDLQDPRIREGLGRTMSIMKDNKDVTFLLIPSKESVYGKLPEEDTVRNELLAFCQDLGLTCIDALPSMKGKLGLYRETQDGHPTAAGYAVIAEVVRRVR